MQNREELRQKGHDGSRKMTCRERGKNIIFRRGGGGINIVFGPKYRPLPHRYYTYFPSCNSRVVEPKLLAEVGAVMKFWLRLEIRQLNFTPKISINREHYVHKICYIKSYFTKKIAHENIVIIGCTCSRIGAETLWKPEPVLKLTVLAPQR